MTIFSFADTRFPIERANGVQTMQTCHALAARGHHVTLLTRPDTHVPPRDPFRFYALPPESRLRVEVAATDGRESIRRARMLWAGVRRALTGGFDVVFTRDLGLAALLCRLPRRARPALVYESHGIAPIVAAEMPQLLGRPDAAPTPAKLARLDRRERAVWRAAEGYVTLTRALADDLAGRYGARPGVAVVPDGATITAAPPPPAARAGDPIAAYAGHLYPWKGVDVFVESLAFAPGVRGLIIGGHPGEADLARVQALVDRRGLAPRVTITGLLPPSDVAAALASADMLVLPNVASAISDRYTSPLKLFEYLACGRAIVASDLPSLRDVLTPDVTAVLVAPGDAEALGRALAALAADPARRTRLGLAARALAPSYSWARRAERLDAVCEAARAA